MDVFDAIASRRSTKRFTGRPVTREELERLLAAAILAPNHHLTQPWRFHVLGPVARHAYGEALGRRKAKKVEDPAAARAVVEKTAAEHEALPAMLAVAMTRHDDAEAREEDYAATMMAVQNLCLAAVATGLGAHIRTGAVMDDPAARAAIGVPDDQRVVATVQLGEPAEGAQAKPRKGVAEVTTWMP
jgi:nitroreductase